MSSCGKCKCGKEATLLATPGKGAADLCCGKRGCGAALAVAPFRLCDVRCPSAWEVLEETHSTSGTTVRRASARAGAVAQRARRPLLWARARPAVFSS
jgi:hypothetical protein